MRPIASTAVASMQNIAAPDKASVLIWVKCQSLASPFSAEYWHIGATMMRLGSARSRSLIGENRALMGISWEGIGLARSSIPRLAQLVMPGHDKEDSSRSFEREACMCSLRLDAGRLDYLKVFRYLARHER